MAVKFHQHNTHSKLRNIRALKSFIPNLFKEERKLLTEINYIFCDDKTLLQINQQYLKHNSFTDIITFNLSEKPTNIIGEVYISIDRIKENAEKFKTGYEQELHRVIFHGALHLCGYEDKFKKDKTIMRKKEDFYLKKYFKS